MRPSQHAAQSSPAYVKRIGAACALAIALLCGGAFFGVSAQLAVSLATLGGRVEDERGAGIGDATVVATNLDTEQQQSTRSDADGRYRFLYLPVGNYHRVKLYFHLRIASALQHPDRHGSQQRHERQRSPFGVGRNTGRGFDFASLDLRPSRRFQLTERVRIEALAEGFNVFNRANLQLPNNIFGAGLTRRARAFAGPLPPPTRASYNSDCASIFDLRLEFEMRALV